MTLTEKDIDEIERIVEEKTGEKTSHLPTRDEFNKRMDDVMTELGSIRTTVEILENRSSEQEDRLTNLEKIHPQGQHSN